MNLDRRVHALDDVSIPRVSGDEPMLKSDIGKEMSYSPRERG